MYQLRPWLCSRRHDWVFDQRVKKDLSDTGLKPPPEIISIFYGTRNLFYTPDTPMVGPLSIRTFAFVIDSRFCFCLLGRPSSTVGRLYSYPQTWFFLLPHRPVPAFTPHLLQHLAFLFYILGAFS